MAWGIPVGGIGTFGGFVDVIGAKGKDGFGVDTKTETLARANFIFDVMGSKSGLTAGVGIEYWNNKFGNKNAIAFTFVKNSARATTPLLLIEYKLQYLVVTFAHVAKRPEKQLMGRFFTEIRPTTSSVPQKPSQTHRPSQTSGS